jgi:hypothetical protein
MADFKPFPVPVRPEDTPLVRHAGAIYACSGCDGAVQDGAWLHEVVEDGMVVGLVARMGADGPEVHRCGRAAQ